MGKNKQEQNKMADEEFENTDAGASLVYPCEAGQIRKGGYIVIKGEPCKVVDYSVSKTGKHGHAKAAITALHIFTGKKLETISPTTHNVEVPNVKRQQLTLIDINEEGFASLMDDEGNTREDLKVPDDLRKSAQEFLDADGDAVVDVLSAMNREQIMSVKKSAQ